MGYTSGFHGRNRSGSMRRLAPWCIGAQPVGILLAGKGVVVVGLEVVLRVDSLHGAVTHKQLNFACHPYVYIGPDVVSLGCQGGSHGRTRSCSTRRRAP